MGDSINLGVGDILYDTVSKDVGVLLNRYDGTRTLPFESTAQLWVWDVFWAGERYVLYTESGLINMIFEGRLLLYRNT